MSKRSWLVVVGVGIAVLVALLWPGADSQTAGAKGAKDKMGDARAERSGRDDGSRGEREADSIASSESSPADKSHGWSAWSTEADDTPDEVYGSSVELFGWVLDVRGEPLAGVTVVAGRTPERRGWRVVTGRDGGFVFARLPKEQLRVTADGGERGVATRWVEPKKARQEVSLVLEPTALLIVQSEVGGTGRVIVRSYEWFEYREPEDAAPVDDGGGAEGAEGADDEGGAEAGGEGGDDGDEEAGAGGVDEGGEEGAGVEGRDDEDDDEPPVVAMSDEEAQRIGRETDIYMESLKETYGPSVFYQGTGGHNIVELGRVGEMIRLRGAREYEVAVALEEAVHGQGFEVSCGVVKLSPGDVVKMRCGKPMKTQIYGRVVDSSGRGVVSAKVTIWNGLDADVVTRTDRRGRFDVAFRAQQAFVCRTRIELDLADESWRPTERRGLDCGPGRRVDAGVIVVHPELEALGHEDDETEAIRSYLRFEGGNLVWTDEGRDGVIEAMGIPPGTELIHVDEEDIARLSIDEVVWRMTTDESADAIWLGMRAPNGDLMDVRFDRPMFVEP